MIKSACNSGGTKDTSLIPGLGGSSGVGNGMYRKPKFSSMNQGKLDLVKQNMAKVNIDILGIGELKWTGMEEFNSDDHL